MKRIDGSISYMLMDKPKKIQFYIRDRYFSPYGILEVFKEVYKETEPLNEVEEGRKELNKYLVGLKNELYQNDYPIEVNVEKKDGHFDFMSRINHEKI